MTKLEVGQVWRFVEPNGHICTFTITHLQRNPYGQRVARGRTSGGHPKMVSALRLEKGEYEAKLVSTERVKKAVGE